jgi:hypothetical protein
MLHPFDIMLVILDEVSPRDAQLLREVAIGAAGLN